MKATSIKRNATPVNPPLKACTCESTTLTHTLTCERVSKDSQPWYYQPRKLSGIEAMAFIGLITEAFPVEERDIISHWFRTLTD